ncbi:hypothetical protein KKA47_06160, partial [bacterium]|nr:hypothetical protein [bacterium]
MRRIILTLAIILFASIVQADAEPPVILGAGPAKLFQFNDVFFTGENFYINNQNKVEEGFVKKKGSTEWVEPMCFDINGGEEGSFYVANMSVGVYDLKIVRSDNQESPIYETAFEILPNQCIVPSVAGVELKGFGYGGGKVTILGNNFMPGLVASILKEDGDVIVTHETYHSITKNTEIPMIVPLSEMEGSSSGLAGLDGKKIVVTNPECDTPTEYSIDVGPAIVSVKHGVVYMNSEATAMIYLSDLASSSYGEIDVSSIDFGCITVLEV